MRRFCDSASVPNAAALKAASRDNVTAWAGYLASPYAARSWSADELSATLDRIGHLLPVYVAPFPAARIVDAHPGRDAAQCLAGLHAIREAASVGLSHPGVLPVALDIEASVWYAHPAATADYFDSFVEAVGTDAYVLPYGVPATLIGLRKHKGEHPAAVWAASWRTDAHWPTDVEPIGLADAWAGRRAWQYHGGIARYGMGVDLNVADDAFPLVAHTSAPPPKPAPHPPANRPPKTIEVTVAVGRKTYRGAIDAA